MTPEIFRPVNNHADIAPGVIEAHMRLIPGYLERQLLDEAIFHLDTALEWTAKAGLDPEFAKPYIETIFPYVLESIEEMLIDWPEDKEQHEEKKKSFSDRVERARYYGKIVGLEIEEKLAVYNQKLARIEERLKKPAWLRWTTKI